MARLALYGEPKIDCIIWTSQTDNHGEPWISLETWAGQGWVTIPVGTGDRNGIKANPQEASISGVFFSNHLSKSLCLVTACTWGVFLAARVKAATEFLAGGLTKRGVPGALDASLCRLASMDFSHALWIDMTNRWMCYCYP